MPTAIELYFLGSLHIQIDGQLVNGFRSQKAQALLAYLALVAQPVTRERLADLFWPNATGDAGRTELRRVVYNLNRRLPGVIHSSRQSLSFEGAADGGEVWLDTAAVERLCAAGNLLQLEQAASLYRGELLEGFYLEECPDFESWLGRERSSWQEKHLHLLRQLTDLYESRGDYERAVQVARQRVELAPWREEAQRRLMLLLARSGRRSEALAQYESCCKVLEEELGVTAQGRTTALYERLRASTSLIRHNLQLAPDPFIGREAQLAQLLSLLKEDGTRLITIVGPGGMGKTRLAVQAAHAVAGHFLDGVAHIRLETVSRPALLPEAIVEALEAAHFMAGAGTDRALAYLQDQLAQREILLLLDNLEHLLSAAPQLAALLEAAPGLKILTTSRERLNLSWERVLRLEGLATPEEDRAGWERYGAVRLFVAAARRANPEFFLTEANRRPVIRICRQVEGMPLALELAATWTRMQSCTAIAERLQTDLSLLARPQRDRGPRQSSVRATFDRSWALLSPGEQVIFSRLGVFRGSFSVAAAQAVAGAGWQQLATLVDKCLLRALVAANDQPARFQLHELLRQYALQMLAEAEQVELARERHCCYYLEMVQAQTAQLQGGDQKAALERMAAEASNMEAAWEWAAQEGRQVLLEAALPGLYLFWKMRSRLERGVNLLAEAVHQLERLGPATVQVRGRVQAHLALLRYYQGEREQAGVDASAALELALRAEDGPGQAVAYLALTHVAYGSGRYGVAAEYGARALAFYEALQDQHGQALALSMLGLTTMVQAKYVEEGQNGQRPPQIRTEYLQQAQVYFQQALVHHRALDDRYDESNTLHNLGYIQYVYGEESGELHHFEAALFSFEEAAALDAVLGVKRPQRLNWLACTLAMLGEQERARDLFREALLWAMHTRRLTEATDILAGIAVYVEEAGAARERAVTLLSLVEAHEATDVRVRQWAQEHRTRIEAKLPTPAAARARARGRTLTLEDVAGGELASG